MSHVIHEVVQGSPEWHAHREVHLNASDAAAMLGISQYVSRADLVRIKATGAEAEITADQQARFDDGHAFEAMARPWAEEIVGEDLYPITASRLVEGLPLSASYDGANMDDTVLFEHKTLNQALRESLARGEIPEQYKPQMEQQLLILGAQKCLFMASNGDRETMLHAWYESDPALRARLITGWAQFTADLAAYQAPEVIPAAVATPTRGLPAVSVQISGDLVVRSNLTLYGSQLKSFIEGIDKEPADDQGFADAEAAIKTLQVAQDRLEAAESAALAQTVTVDEMRRTVAEYRDLARNTRLYLEKQVKAQKDKVRAQIMIDGRDALARHVASLNERLGRPWMPTVAADWASAMRSKRTITSLRDSVDTCLANAKIDANATADRMAINLRLLDEIAKEHQFLFADAQQLVLKAPDDFAAAVKNRVTEHKAKEEARMEAERARIRLEEEAKAQREAEQRRLAEERQARQVKEAAESAARADAAEAQRKAQAEADRLEAERRRQEAVERQKREAQEAAARAAQAKRDAAERAKRDAAEAKEREKQRERAERADADQMLTLFVQRFGDRKEFAKIKTAIGQYFDTKAKQAA